jgi:hypothetical protein
VVLLNGLTMTVMNGLTMTVMNGLTMTVMNGLTMTVMNGLTMTVMNDLAMTVGMPVAIFCRRINIPAGVRIENVEFGAHQPVFAYLARPDAKAFQSEGIDVFTNNFNISASVDQSPYKHIAADTGRCIEIENLRHLICSFRFTPAASLLIISAW